MSQSEAASRHAIVIERILPHPPEKIWRVLTTSELISEWLMPNDFQPAVGHKFSFRTQPWGNWNGVVDAEVLECDPPRRLRYSWVSGTTGEAGHGSGLDTVVTWTLTPAEGGTRLHMEHDGFGPNNQFEHKGASGGWVRNIGKIAELADTLNDEAESWSKEMDQ
jgi:uncharacterized protein YndB with AHSA1/START domain